MAIDIQFSDFDTACYNLQYNVMQLIKTSVGIGVEINVVLGQVASDKADLDNQISHINGQQAITDQHVYELSNLVQDLINALGTVHQVLEDVNAVLQNHEERIKALEGG